MRLSAALDLSVAEVAFAVADLEKGCVVFEEFVPMIGRTSAGMLLWMKSCAEKHGLSLNDIVEWTVGTGPGSFTGLRLVAALVSGFTFQKEGVKTRTLPTALALAAGLSEDKSVSVASLHDGRRNELLMFGMKSDGKTVFENGDTRVVTPGEESEKLIATYDRFVAVASDKNAVIKTFGEEQAEQVTYFDHIPISNLIFIESDNWGEDMTDLVYIRPAVFIEPRKIREV